MTQTTNTAHVFNCCAMIAAGIVFMLIQCFTVPIPFSSPPGGAWPPLHLLLPSLVSACLVSNGCIGLVAFFARSLPCALLYIIGLMTNQLLVVTLLTWALATTREMGNDAAAMACLGFLAALLFVIGLPATSKPERRLLRDVQAPQADLLHSLNSVCVHAKMIV